MERLISPNGVLVDANESAVKALLDNGYKPAEEIEKPKRARRKKANADEGLNHGR